jgi:hypothetical protein
VKRKKMPWISVEKKVIGTVELKEEEAPPAPPAPPSPIIASFLEEHRKLKAIIDRHGTRGECVTRGTLESEGNVSSERLGKHIDVFRAHHAVSEVDGDILCGRESLSKLKKKIRLEL